MYDLLFKLSEYYRTDYCGKYRIISKGITYHEQEEKQELKIGEIASLCNVSEVQSVDKPKILFLRRSRRIFRFSADMRGGKTHYKRKTAE